MFEKIGIQLKEAREAAGMKPADAASAIKIDLRFLEQMEKGDFTFLGEVYVKAFLRDYAKLLNLNVDALMKQYDSIKTGTTGGENTEGESDAGVPPPALHKVQAGFNNDSLSGEKLMQKKKNMMIAGTFVLVILSVFIYLLVGSGETELIVKQRPFEDVLKQNKQRYETPQQEVTAPSAVIGDSLTLRITASDSVWVRIVADNIQANEYALVKGSIVTLKAGKDFTVHFGNSYALSLQLNGKPFQLPEKRSRVYKAVIIKEGVKQ